METNSIHLVQLSTEQLRNAIQEGVKSQLDDFKKHFQTNQPTEVLTRQEVAKLLSVDVSTIHVWTRKGILKSYGFAESSRVYYKRSEIENALVEIKKAV